MSLTTSWSDPVQVAEAGVFPLLAAGGVVAIAAKYIAQKVNVFCITLYPLLRIFIIKRINGLSLEKIDVWS